jgi:O-antigen/teichoic acid export membrane protein
VSSSQPDSHRSIEARIVAGSVTLLSGSGLAAAPNLVYNVAVARLLGPRAFGHAAAVYTLLVLASAATLAFQIVSAKFVSQQSTLEEKSAAYRLLHRGAWGCGLLAAFALVLLRGSIAAWLRLPAPLLVVLLALGVAFYVPLGARRGYAQGALNFRRFAGNLALEGAVRLVGSLLAIALGLGVAGVIAANAVAVAVCWIAIAPPLTASAPGALRLPRASREVLQALIFYSGLVLINNSGIVLVKHYLLPVEAGLYAAVAMVGRVIFLFSSAAVNSMFPVVASARPEERKSGRALRATLFLVISVGAVAVVALRLMPAAAWHLIFGARFTTSGPYSLSYLFAMYAAATVIYSLSIVIVTWEMSYRIANSSWVQLAFSGVLIAAICRFHDSLHQVIAVQLLLMILLLIAVSLPLVLGALRTARARGGAQKPEAEFTRVLESSG